MLSIAIKMLLHNKVRSISTVIGIAMAFFLSAAQIGLLVGWCNTTSAIVRHADADVWIMAKGTKAFDYGMPIPKQRLDQVRSVPGVAWAESLYMGWVPWHCPDGRTSYVEMVGLDNDLAGGPWSMAENDVEVVLEPDAVIVDSLYASQLGVSQTGAEVEVGDRRAIVRGISKGVRTFTASPFIFTSLNSARKYDVRLRPDEVTYIVARSDGSLSADQLREQIAGSVSTVDVLTAREFAVKTMKFWMLDTGAGIMAVTTAILGFVIGTVIVSQALYAITNDHLPNYATLLAIGFARWKLIVIVLIQGIVLGISGFVIGSGLFGRVSALSQSSPLPIEATPAIFGGVLLALLASCLVASIVSLRSIFRIDPITVFRA